MSDRDAASPVIGIDVGGTNLQVGVVDADDRIIGRARGKTEARDGLEHVLDVIHGAIDDACADAGLPLDRVGAVGVAAAGAIDVPRGVVLTAPHLGWTDVPLRDLLEKRLGRPVVLDNDVNGAVWAEYRLGPAGGRGDALGVWVGTGVGGGLVLGGALHHGAFFTAGEIGHTVVIPDEAPGARTVEDLCSRTGLRRILARGIEGSRVAEMTGGDPERIGTAEIAACYAAGDAHVTTAVDRSAALLGTAIANWVTMLAIDRVLLGGGMTEALAAPYVAQVRAAFDANVFPERCRGCRLEVTRLEADAGLLGAALLARG